jgi:hypothetical protein
VWANPGGIGGCPAGTHGVDALGSDCDPQDEHYHGTHVAGTIGAVGNNGVGVVGIDWNVSLMALRFLDSKGNGNVGDAIAAIDFAVKAKQAGVNMRVLNNSWGGSGFSQALLDEIQKAGANDILFVDAAGNSGDNLDVSPSYPASYVAPNELTVAATDASDQLATFSSYGSGSVDLAAPGVEIYSTVPGGYTFLSGTSMAAPQVSGAAALLLARCSASASQVKATIRQSAVALPALAGRTANGGRLDVLGAVANCTPPLESTFPPAIAGAAQEGRTLTATTGSWNRGPLTYAYQWRHCLPASSACADIPGAQEPSYVVGAADVDSSLRVTVTASDGATTASAVSAPTAAALPAAPRNTNVPAIVGRPRRGSKLSATRGEWQSSRPLSFAFQWQRCGRNSGCVAIPGATGASYRVVAADTGRSLRVVVSASNAGGSAAARSPARAVAAAAPWISGTPKVGHVLRAHAGTAGRFRYQWLRCTGHRCSAIRRASSPRYRVRRADIGRRLKVRVTAAGRSLRGHNSSSTSRATAVVRR